MGWRAVLGLGALLGCWTASVGAEPQDAPGTEAEESPEELRRLALESEKELHEKAEASVPEGWSADRMGRFLVIHQDSKKHGERYVEQGQAILDWLDAAFPYIGGERYVRGPILRVAKDYDELKWLRKELGDSSWRGEDLETLCCCGTTS